MWPPGWSFKHDFFIHPSVCSPYNTLSTYYVLGSNPGPGVHCEQDRHCPRSRPALPHFGPPSSSSAVLLLRTSSQVSPH